MSRAARPAKPNFIVIQTDDQNIRSLRATYRGQGGSSRKAMPNTLRHIVNAGTEFRRTYPASPLCSPSRAALLTGQYPHNNGLVGNGGGNGGWSGWQALPIERENLVAALDQAGYRTAHFGKFTNNYFRLDAGLPETSAPPEYDRWLTKSFRSGEARFYGYQVNGDGEVRGPIGNPRYELTGDTTDPSGLCSTESLKRSTGIGNCRHLDDFMTRAAVKEIRRNAKSSSRMPFFLQIDYLGPHGDVRPPAGPQPASRHVFSASRTALPRPASFNESDVSDKPPFLQAETQPLTDRQKSSLRSRWHRTLESLKGVDDGVGAIVSTLMQLGALNNTYIFFVSDNGLFFGEHRIMDGKGRPYEPSARVPLAVTGPGVKRGGQSNELTSNIDVGATVLSLARVEPDYTVDGRSLEPFLGNPKLTSSRPLLFSLDPQGDVEGGISERSSTPLTKFEAVRVGPYKYVEYVDGSAELYDLSRDRDELRNRINSNRYGEVLRYMRDRLAEMRICSGNTCRENVPPWPEAGSSSR